MGGAPTPSSPAVATVMAYDPVSTAWTRKSDVPTARSGGKIAGAWEGDGLGSHVSLPFVCDPSQGPLGARAWVKGGGPGQVIVSQAGGVDWLMIGPEGTLRTGLRPSGRQSAALSSSTIIMDGAWHRVGLAWDGTERILYVDDVEVARDAPTSLAGSTGGLYLGAGSALSAGSFWSGLIDDVRIYDRAVKP